MCGICGVVQVEGPPREVVSADRLDAMTDMLTHRGPNDRGTFLSPGVAFGVRRLSIVDVEGGHQPFFSEDGQVCGMQNGELYNHDAIRESLQSAGHRFASRCDTEILPHLYERDGELFGESLRGKFAAAVWDGRRRRAVVVRDRLGVKPLYWARCGDVVVFGSELKSVLASGLVDRALDLEAIDAYLTLGYVPFPMTPFASVSKLPPGGFLAIGEGDVSEGRYWSYPVPNPDARRSFADCVDELDALLAEAVRLRLMSDVPLGAMLSGGLDSSLVVALMAEASTQPVRTFAIGFREDGDQNELGHAARVARLFGCDHHEIELSFEDDASELEDIIWHLDEPIAELSTVGFHSLSRLAAPHVTVALSGQGADELFGGYRKHLAARLIDLSRLPAPLRRGLGALPIGGDDLRRLLRAAAAPTPADRLLAMSASLGDDGLARLRGPRLRDLDGASARRSIESLSSRLQPGTSALGSTLFLDGQLALVDNMLHYFDRMSMAVSLEVRVPYLDHVLVEWAATVPDSAKVGLREQKRVLREVARRRLPADIVDRPKVAFFRRSAAAWLERRLAGPLADRISESDRLHDLLNRDEIRSLVARFRAGERASAQILLAIVMLDLWLERFASPTFGLDPVAAGDRS